MRLRRVSAVAVAASLLMLSVSPSAAEAPWVGFEDVPTSNTFFSDIQWLHEQGITLGCDPPDNTLFCPKDPVTRGQMAAFLVRALDLPMPTTSDWFEDDDESIFEASIDRLATLGIAKGCNPPENTMFCPDDPVTREQMASFLVRALDLEMGAGVDWFSDDDHSVHEANIDRLRAAWITVGCNPPYGYRFCPADYVAREEMAAFLHRALTQPIPGAALKVHGSVWPDPLYIFADVVVTFEVRNAGSVPVSNVTAGPYTPEGEDWAWGDCTETDYISDPRERLGNGDDLLEPGEIWDWYCSTTTMYEVGDFYLEAEGMDGNVEVSAWGKVRYTARDPVELAATVSDSSVSPGTEVTWTINLHNLSPAMLSPVQLEVRKNGLGTFTVYDSPALELVGDDDLVLEFGEVWQYVHTEPIWSDTFLSILATYMAEAHPYGLADTVHLDSEVVKVVVDDPVAG